MSARVSGSTVQKLYYRYFLGPNHPMKLRICGYLRKVIKDGQVVISYHGSGKIAVDEQDHIGRYILKHGCYEPEVFETLMSFADTDEVVWDIGAHIGSFCIKCMMDPRVAITYAFEPFRQTFPLLARNVSLNTGSCVIVNAGLSDRPELREMSGPPQGNSGMAYMGCAAGTNAGTIRCFSVDSLVERGYMKPPTLVKIDVEGWEHKVLEGARETFSKRGPKAVVFEAENGPHGGIADGALRGFFQQYDYRVAWIPRPQGDVFTRENYIAVRSP